MAHKLDTLVCEASTTTGTGAYTLAGPITEAGFTYNDFSFLADGDTTWVTVTGGADFEEVLVTKSGATLLRTAVLRSSNGDAAVDWPAGPRIWCTMPASVFSDGAATLAEKVAARDGLGAQRATSFGSVTTLSGTNVDFAVPAGAQRVCIPFAGASLSDIENPMIQLGDAGGIEDFGYTSTRLNFYSATSDGANTDTTGLIIGRYVGGSRNFHGRIDLLLIDPATNLWKMDYVGGRDDLAEINISSAFKALTQALTTVRMTSLGAAASYDAGTGRLIADF
jgi:hypothetical protein